MRKPEDRRCMDVCNDDCEELKLRWAMIDATLVLIESMLILLDYLGFSIRNLA